MEKGIMSESIYRKGNLFAVSRCLNDSQITFEKFVGNRKLMDLLRDTYNGKIMGEYFPCVKS
jgi:hypothetical protein